jgi:hypothetical protein
MCRVPLRAELGGRLDWPRCLTERRVPPSVRGGGGQQPIEIKRWPITVIVGLGARR